MPCLLWTWIFTALPRIWSVPSIPSFTQWFHSSFRLQLFYGHICFIQEAFSDFLKEGQVYLLNIPSYLLKILWKQHTLMLTVFFFSNACLPIMFYDKGWICDGHWCMSWAPSRPLETSKYAMHILNKQMNEWTNFSLSQSCRALSCVPGSDFLPGLGSNVSSQTEDVQHSTSLLRRQTQEG